MPRELSKCRNWEKERRNRLNEAFSSLCKTLPCYDPAVNTSKIEILNNAKIHIEELETKIKNLLSENKNEASKAKSGEITKLQERIKKLLAKNEQLCSLLREAKISIPPGCGVVMKKFKSPLYWSNRITSEQAKILQQKELEKENNNAAADKKTRKLCITKAKAKSNQNNTPKHRKVMVNRLENKKIRVKRRKKPQQQQCLIVLTQSSIVPPQNCYVITANSPQTKTMITNSTLLTTPIVSVGSKAAPKPISTIPSLGAGTLILANGTIMPVLPTQPTVLPQVINQQAPQQQNPTVILVSKQAKVQNPCKSGKALAKIKPKYCLTQTTQVNKVPIPALTSRYANNKDLLSKEAKCAKKSEKKAQKKDSEENGEENVSKRKSQQDEQTENSAKKSKTDETNPETSKEPSQPSNTESIDRNPQPAAEKDTIQEEKAQTPPPQTEIIAPPPADPLPAVPEIVQEPKTLDKHVSEENTPTNSEMKNIELNINHSELSNDIFASLNVPSGCQNPESTSPTAAFLLAFPLVSTGVKVTEVTEDDNTESQRGTPTLLQIGTMDTTKSTQSHQADSFTPSLLNLDNLSFFSKDFYNSLENNLSSAATATVTSTITTTTSSVKSTTKVSENLEKETKLGYEPNKNELVSCFDGANQRLVQNQTYHVEKKQEVQKQNSCSNYVPHKTFASNANIGYFNESTMKTTTYASSNVIKSYPDPLYTNSNSYTYSYSDTNFNQNYYKNIAKSDANHRSYYSLNYENYSDYHHRKNESTPNYYSAANSKKVATSSKPPINWMTAPDNVSNNNNHKDNDFGSVSSFNTFSNSAPQTNYFNSNSVYNNNELVNSQESMKKTLDLPLVGAAVNNYQRQETEENQQFAWSPTKLPQLLDHPHNFVSSTLPTLVGDLALGNSLFDKSDAKCLHKSSKQEPARRVKNYENQTNFLSVSQLVDHNNKETMGKSSRRSGNRPTNAAVKKVQSKNQSSRKNHHEKDVSKNTNNYSAEALIGHHQMPSDAKSRQNYSNSKSMSVPFLTDNILPYFPPVDLQQADNNYMQQNQNYQSTTAFGHNFSAGNNYSYTPNTFIPAATTITSTYLSSTNNFMHDSTATPHEYNDLFTNASKEKNCNKNVNNQRNVQQSNVVCGNVKKSKRKHHSNEQQSNLPNFVDFPFLSMPGAINSPILPDDFHSGFLPAPPPAPTTSSQLYSCKNPLYSKQNDLGSSSLLSLSRSNMAQEVSPSINSAGTSLTNFNLSTIFPEINNKSAIPDPSYLEPARIKDHGARGYASTAQVSFNEKPSFSFSYINSTSQSYNQLN